MHLIKVDEALYKNLLEQYLKVQDEQYLEKAKRMSVSFVNRNIYPEEIVRIHMDAIDQIYENEGMEYKISMEFLFESLVAYREGHERYQAIKEESQELKAEMEVAATMQQTLLTHEIPDIPGLDIGAITAPYKQLNGDYYHFVKSDDGTLGVALADVIGKGVPAALSMSMIKYALDSYHEEVMTPSAILRYLNRVVERNVAANMFITMFYGQYFKDSSIFRYASAGHEPGFIYRVKEGKFEEIVSQGLVLGVVKHTYYMQYELELQPGDYIVLLTDGVTESIHSGRFIEREEVMEVIEMYDHLPAQEQVNQVYAHFYGLADLELRDDFTLIIIKKEV